MYSMYCNVVILLLSNNATQLHTSSSHRHCHHQWPPNTRVVWCVHMEYGLRGLFPACGCTVVAFAVFPTPENDKSSRVCASPDAHPSIVRVQDVVVVLSAVRHSTDSVRVSDLSSFRPTTSTRQCCVAPRRYIYIYTHSFFPPLPVWRYSAVRIAALLSAVRTRSEQSFRQAESSQLASVSLFFFCCCWFHHKVNLLVVEWEQCINVVLRRADRKKSVSTTTRTRMADIFNFFSPRVRSPF